MLRSLLEQLARLVEATYCSACGGVGVHKRGCPVGEKGSPVEPEHAPLAGGADTSWRKSFVDSYVATELERVAQSPGQVMSTFALKKARKDCDKFIDANWDDLKGLYPEITGALFSLSRNKHKNDGFWATNELHRDVAMRLNDAAVKTGETSLSVGSDGSVNYN